MEESPFQTSWYLGFKQMISTAASILGQQVEVVVATQPRRLEISLAKTLPELLGSFKILYQAYARAGLVNENPHEVRLTPFHLLPSTEVIIAKLAETVTSTLTLVADSDDGLPMEDMYGDELDRIRQSGLRVAEIGCLADRRQSPVRFIKVFGELARLAVQVAAHRSIGGLVVATHPRHAGFYSRSFGFQQFGDIRGCPYVKGNPAVGMLLDFGRIQGTALHECLFGNPVDQKLLVREPRDPETLEHLNKLLQLIASP
jgi:hypothetical protein